MERLLVIGGDAAGMSAASQARRLRPAGDLAITVIERGTTTSYAACGIPYWVAGLVEERSSLIARRAEVFRDKQQIDVHLRHEATRIDTAAREVHVTDLSDGSVQTFGYDQLLIATGAQPVPPPVDGLDTPGVFPVQTLEDGQRILDSLASRSLGRSPTSQGSGFKRCVRMRQPPLDSSARMSSTRESANCSRASGMDHSDVHMACPSPTSSTGWGLRNMSEAGDSHEWPSRD
jgi:hypothetical protein